MGDTMMSPSGTVTIRRMFFGLGGLFATIVFGLFLFPLLLPSGIEKSFVASALEKIFKRPVIVSGDASFSVLPKIRLSAENIVIASDQDGDSPVLLDISSLHLQAGAISLLSNTLAIDRLSIDQPIFRLSRDKTGKVNWKSTQSSPTAGILKKPDYDWGWWHDLKIGDVGLARGRFIFDDKMQGRRITGENANLRVMISSVTGANDGLSIDGGIDVNGEPVRLRLDLGSMKKLLSGGRMPMVAEISAVPLNIRYQGTIANRQYMVTDGQMSVDAPSVNRLESWLGQVFSSPVDGGVIWKSRLITNGNSTAFEDMRLDLGDGRYSGDLRLDAGVEGYKLDGTIIATKLNLGALSTMIPGGQWFEGVGGRLRLEWGLGSYGDLQFGKGELSISFMPKKRRISLDLARTALYGGRASGQVRIASGEGMTSLDANFDLSRVAVGNLLMAMRASTQVTGDANVHLGLFSVGRDAKEMLAALRGQGGFNIVRGAVTNENLVEHLRIANRDALEFSQLIGSFSINQGIIEGRDLLLKAPNFSLIGDGTVDLSRGEIDIHLQSLLRAKDGDDGGVQRVSPFRLLGTLAKIEILDE